MGRPAGGQGAGRNQLYFLTSAENIEAIHKIFSSVQEERAAQGQTEPENQDSQVETTEDSHYDEMETESK